MISDRTKLALIIGLATTLAYGVALSMDWQRPYWAGLAIAVVGLSTFGESLFKGIQRLAGTVVGIAVALTTISLFAQHRWLFATAISLWIGFCVWRMLSDSTRYYFWFCSAFIAPLLAMMSDFDSATSFYVIEERSKETALGILCFTAAGLLLAARTAYDRQKDEISQLMDLLHERNEDIRHLILGRGRRPGANERSEKLAQGFMRLPTLHAATQLESFEGRERSHSWLMLQDVLKKIAMELDHLGISLEAAQRLPDGNLPGQDRILHDLDEFSARLKSLAAIPTEGAAAYDPKEISPPHTVPEDFPGPTFEAGELLLRADIIAELDARTHECLALAADISDQRFLTRKGELPKRWQTILPDPESIYLSLMMMMIYWTGFLIYIYVPDIPDGPMLTILSVAMGINLCRTPWKPALAMLVPLSFACANGWIAHVLILPHLQGFFQLGLLIFGGTFFLAWIFPGEERVAPRLLSIVYFNIILKISNDHQEFSATYGMNLFMVIVLTLSLITFFQRFPISFRPEHQLRRYLFRFGHSLIRVLDDMRWDRPIAGSWLQR
ncbi:MAG: FUSC family protein, partial [Hyphomicrobiaceae bacterium]